MGPAIGTFLRATPGQISRGIAFLPNTRAPQTLGPNTRPIHTNGTSNRAAIDRDDHKTFNRLSARALCVYYIASFQVIADRAHT